MRVPELGANERHRFEEFEEFDSVEALQTFISVLDDSLPNGEILRVSGSTLYISTYASGFRCMVLFEQLNRFLEATSSPLAITLTGTLPRIVR